MIKMTMDHQPNVETSIKCSEAEVTALELVSEAAATIAAAALEVVEAALAAAAEVLEAAEVALAEAVVVLEAAMEATAEDLVGAKGAVEVASTVAEVSGGDVVLGTEEVMGGVAIRIMLNVNCVFVTVL